MSLFFGDFPTEDTLAPVAMVNNVMFFACPACGACVVEWESQKTNRHLHEAWHNDTDWGPTKSGFRSTVDGGDVVKVGNWGVAPDACGPECSEMHTFVAPCVLALPDEAVLTDDDIETERWSERRIRVVDGEIWPRIEPPEVW